MKNFTVYILSARRILILKGHAPGRRNMEKFIFGAVVGMAAGALLVANNCKLRNLVKKNQEDLMEKAENYIDTKLEELEKTAKEKKSSAKTSE